MDDIWAAFKEETAAVRPATSSCVKHKAGKTDVKSQEEVKALKSSTVETRDKETPKKIEITEIFDFAGEEVKYVVFVSFTCFLPLQYNCINSLKLRNAPSTILIEINSSK